MDKPSFTRRWIRDAKVAGSSRLNPEARREVSYSSQMRSFTVLSDWSASAFSRSAVMMEFVGLISIVFLLVMYALWLESRRAWAFMMRSMLADQPYSPVTRQQGLSARRFDTTTFSTLSSRTSFISLHSPSAF